MEKLGNKLKIKKKLGVLGGSFDPAHKGHLAISKEAVKKFKLKKVIWAMTDKKCGGMSKFNILSNDNLNHKVLVESGLLEEESKKMMQKFFSKIRKKKKS